MGGGSTLKILFLFKKPNFMCMFYNHPWRVEWELRFLLYMLLYWLSLLHWARFTFEIKNKLKIRKEKSKIAPPFQSCLWKEEYHLSFMILEQIYQEINTKKQLGMLQVYLVIFGPSMEERSTKRRNAWTLAESVKEVGKDKNNTRMSLYRYRTKLT